MAIDFFIDRRFSRCLRIEWPHSHCLIDESRDEVAVLLVSDIRFLFTDHVIYFLSHPVLHLLMLAHEQKDPSQSHGCSLSASKEEVKYCVDQVVPFEVRYHPMVFRLCFDLCCDDCITEGIIFAGSM